jgi:hypothetical protein
MSLNHQIAEHTASMVKAAWGGRYPTWSEFKQCSREGQVRVDKTVAAEAIYLDPVPPSFRILYGYVTLWAGFLAVPVSLTLWLMSDLSAWFILVGVILGWYLVRVARDGHCEGITTAAENDETFYQRLVESGAFILEPAPTNSVGRDPAQ